MDEELRAAIALSMAEDGAGSSATEGKSSVVNATSNSSSSSATANVVNDEMDDELRAALALSMTDGDPPTAAAAAPAVESIDEDEELRAALAMSVGQEPPPKAAPSANLTPAGLPAPNALDFAGLAKAMESLASAGLFAGAGAGAGSKGVKRRRGGSIGSALTPLPYVLDADVLTQLVSEHPSVRDTLLPLLPPGQQTLEHLLATFRSPQLRQAGMSLSAALDDSNGPAVFATFGLRPEDGAEAMMRGDAVGALVAAVQADVDRQAKAAALGPGAVVDSAPAAPASSASVAAPGAVVEASSSQPSVGDSGPAGAAVDSKES